MGKLLVPILLLLTAAAAEAQVGTTRLASGLDSPVYLTAPPGSIGSSSCVFAASDK